MTDATANPLPSLIRMTVSGVARHVVTGLAGALVAAGAIQPDQQTQFVTIASGLIVWGAGVAWSYANKKAVAVAAAPVDPPH